MMCYTKLSAQSSEDLRNTIEEIVKGQRAKIGVSIFDQNAQELIAINADEQFAMQSVFKVHIALTVLAEIDRGNLQLDELIEISKKQMLPNIHSPIRDMNPNGVVMPLGDIIEFMVSKSDNIACDVLLNLLGGPQVVELYFVNNGFDKISIKINEEVMQSNWELQFDNWTTPRSANQVLSAFHHKDQKFLSATSYRNFWDTMLHTETGKKRLKGLLPDHTPVAHKTGWSGQNDKGVTEAVNHIGVVYLPNGEYFYISVFITHSIEDFDTNELTIAKIAKAAWDYFN